VQHYPTGPTITTVDLSRAFACLENLWFHQPAPPYAAINAERIVAQIPIIAIGRIDPLKLDWFVQIALKLNRELDLIKRGVCFACDRVIVFDKFGFVCKYNAYGPLVTSSVRDEDFRR
jgi:hypothetical protein